MTRAADLGAKYIQLGLSNTHIKSFDLFAEKDGPATNIHRGVPFQGVHPGHHLSPAWENQPDGDLSFRLKSFNLFKVSSLSFGASSLGGVFKATDDSESAGLVKRVLQQGINYIDTAPW